MKLSESTSPHSVGDSNEGAASRGSSRITLARVTVRRKAFRMTKLNRYAQIIERIFLDRYKKGMREVSFEREDLVRVAKSLRIKLPKNLGDLVYTFGYRGALPDTIREKRDAMNTGSFDLPDGGTRSCLRRNHPLCRTEPLAEIKVPDSTPGLIETYALNDEQALLAKLRYNRLIDVFRESLAIPFKATYAPRLPGLVRSRPTRSTSVSICRGVHYVFPVQAKGGHDVLNVVQIEQDFAVCAAKFPALVCRPIAAQFMGENLIAIRFRA